MHLTFFFPGEWIDSSNRVQNKTKDSTEEKISVVEISEKDDKLKGDPEMAPVYMKRLVPVFASTYQNSLVISIKKATLSVLKKIINFIPASIMEELASGNVAAQLADVVATALATEVILENLFFISILA